MATRVETAQATGNLTGEPAEAVVTDLIPSATEDLKKTETAPAKEAVHQDVTSTAVTTAIQPIEEVKAESSSAAVVSDVPSASKDLKTIKTKAPKEGVLATVYDAPRTTNGTSTDVPAPKVEVLKTKPMATAVAGAATSATADAKDIKGAPSTTATTVSPPPKTEEVKIASVSTVVAGVVGDLKNVEVGVAKEAVPATGHDASAPSLVTTLEGGLRIVEKEAEKGAAETVATVEQHPELIAEGALAAVVGAASLVQPELLPGAVAMVGKMASDSVKNTVTKIATDEGKKVATAIVKDVSVDAAKEKATEAAAKPSGDGAKAENPVAQDVPEVKSNPVDTSEQNPKAPEPPISLVNGQETTEKLTIEKPAQPEASNEVTTEQPLKSEVQSVPTIPQKVDGVSNEVKNPSESPPGESKQSTSPGPQQPSSSRQEPEPAVIAAVSSSVTTTKMTIKDEAEVPMEKQLVTISQESLDLLHKKIDAMHEAIKHITETLALHLPDTTPVLEASKQVTAATVPSEQTSEPELVSAPAEAPVAPESPLADPKKTSAEPVTPSTEQSSPKRPNLGKRSSALGSMGKIFWPFGSSSPTKTVVEQTGNAKANPDTPKVPTVTVSEVAPTPEIEI